MYCGTTLTNLSGNIIGAHQKLDRSARWVLRDYLIDDQSFPSIKKILHFEGNNGPDAGKAKYDKENAPWHFYDPFDPEDGELIIQIESHYQNLVKSLKEKQLERAAFEASWLAHAIVDGLTPAHHYPFEAELEKLRGESKETRDSIMKKIIIKGETKFEYLTKNWKFWGAKGLFTTHFLFEHGAGIIIFTMKKNMAIPSQYDIKTIEHLGLAGYFKRIAREVALLNMYEKFYEKGWNSELAKLTKKELAPKMAQTTTLAWYMAAKDAGLVH